MSFKIVQTDDADAGALTNSELIGISILVRENMGEPYDDMNVYCRGWQKIQPAVQAALKIEQAEWPC